MGNDFVVSFMPARECAYCDVITSQGLAQCKDNHADFTVVPLCPEHGYVSPGVGGLQGEYESVSRYVVWFYQMRGCAVVIGPCELESIDEWRREHPSPVKVDVLQVKAWQVRYTSAQGHESTCFVVWNVERGEFEYYEENKKKEGHQPVNEHAKQKMNLYSQYSQVYGELATTGQYSVGDRVHFDGGQVGEVIWKYHSANGLMYVLDDNTGFPTEERSQDVEGKVL